MPQTFQNISESDIREGIRVIHKQSNIPYIITEIKNGQIVLRPDSFMVLPETINNYFGYVIAKTKGGRKSLCRKHRNDKKTRRCRR